MEDPEHNDRVLEQHIDDHIREPTHGSLSETAMDPLETARMPCDEVDATQDFRKELNTQAGSSRFVPRHGMGNVIPGLVVETERKAHARRFFSACAFTSSQVQVVASPFK